MSAPNKLRVKHHCTARAITLMIDDNVPSGAASKFTGWGANIRGRIVRHRYPVKFDLDEIEHELHEIISVEGDEAFEEFVIGGKMGSRGTAADDFLKYVFEELL